ncbi:TPA: DUF2075 domain-containing protein [Vibrio parahaemolyticus]|nr:DUF2075 domain-containing protein [Vibrio parahaemolyticus]HCE3432327.1 DUF2075 domain-containing protein [Vibrio parahaemolyticus]HCG7276797.1 DUF2075 domain-containing protein [Vibrio parahaemolyticus]HCM0732442.1 DUF2075 domain-containing protein [Vibrio parahaemolyticus]
MEQKERSGWSGNWEQFFSVSKDDFLSALKDFYAQLQWTTELALSQENAWSIEFDVVQKTLQTVREQVEFDPGLCWISFEQELVGEGGKRAADVNLVLPTGDLIVIEFKHKLQASPQEIIRASFDMQTMLKFHSESAQLNGHCFLALTKPGAMGFEAPGVICDIAEHHQLPKLTNTLVGLLRKPSIYDVSQWQHGDFYRQPSILHGTVKVFFDETIPTLKTEAAQNILVARQHLVELYTHAKNNKKRFVVVVNGRPGAGKTLLGISIVADLVNQLGAEHCKPVFLSGNRPLVQVLQHTLDYYGKKKNKKASIDGRSLIQDLVNFKKIIKRNLSERTENFVVFDEAQRAWERVEPRNANSPSELELLCQWLSQQEFGVLLLLVGDGQAIHDHEMSLEQMLVALEAALINHADAITPIMPSIHQHHFSRINPLIRDEFHLPTPIRQAYTENLDAWIEAVLKGDSDSAFHQAQMLHHCYPLLLAQDRQKAEQYAQDLQIELHEGNKYPDAFRVGWLMSSKGQRFITEISTGSPLVGPWYVEPPQSQNSCCRLEAACTEFTSQGLELSIALFNWGNDFTYRNGQFCIGSGQQRKQEHYTYGSYRVLLSRGRSGLIIKCDDNETYQFLSQCGMKVIE